MIITPFTPPSPANHHPAHVQRLNAADQEKLRGTDGDLGRLFTNGTRLITGDKKRPGVYEYRRMTDKPRRPYPPIKPYATGYLDVGDGHELYYEEVGNPKGLPVVFLHGGPGGGISEIYRQYFDPKKWRVILFDQRGAGKSKPFSELKGNDTWSLVGDIEKLRIRAGVDRWTVFGGSWGATLALAYAESHPERVNGIILRGVFLGRRSELDWLYKEGGASRLFADAWKRFAEHVAPRERKDLGRAYYKRMTGKDAAVRTAAAVEWTRWESTIAKLYVDWQGVKDVDKEPNTDALSRIEAHYMANELWLKEGQLLKNAKRIANIPTVIVQGRYDVICPSQSAMDLYEKLNRAALVITPDSGHSMKEPGTTSALVETTDYFARHLKTR